MNNPLRVFGTEPGPQDGVYSRETFRSLVRHERSRADRDGSTFSLIVFEVEWGRSSRLLSIIERMRQRVRSIDTIGWMGESLLALLLPATPLEGAWKLAAEFEAEMADSFEPPPFTVYSYPKHWYETWEDGKAPGDGPEGVAADPTRTAGEAAGGPVGSKEGPGPGGGPLEDRVRSAVCSLFAFPLPRWKRALDVTLALAAVLALGPLLALIALGVWVASPGPVLFNQVRVGHGGKPFRFLKFRTMKVGSGVESHRIHLVDLIHSDRPMEKLDRDRDDRLIPGGRFLRRTSLDELPQLVNVLKGEMSLVGPRPCIPYEAREYQRWHTERFDVPPGMTGLWQVSGKNRLTFRQMIRLDIVYGRRLSPGRDLVILLRTVPTLVQLAFERSSPGPAPTERAPLGRAAPRGPDSGAPGREAEGPEYPICATLEAIAEKYAGEYGEEQYL